MGKRREGGGTKSYAAPLQDYHSARRLEYFFSDLDATVPLPAQFCRGSCKCRQNCHSSGSVIFLASLSGSAGDVPRDVADEGAGVEGDEREHDDADPDAGPEAEGQVLEPHALAEVEHDGLKHEDGPRRT